MRANPLGVTRAILSFSLTAVCVLSIAQIPANAQTIGLNFVGTNQSQSGFRPPDNMGTVGHNHVVEMINGRFAVYNKSNGSQVSSISLDQFWVNAGVNPAGSFSFDPRVQYDPFANRFYATSVDNARGPNNILFAVSDSDDPTGSWSGFSVDADSDNAQWADFPQMGFSRDQIVISNNMFGLSGNPFQINLLVIPKADILTAAPTLTNATLLESQYANTGFSFSLQSTIDLDNSNRRLRLFSRESGAAGSLSTIEIGGTVGSPVVNNIADVSGLTNFSAPPMADQPDGALQLESGGDRTRSALTLINGKIYGIHGAEDPVSGNAALQWYRLDADTLAIEAQGMIADADLDLIYASISANENGDIVVGFTGTSENQFASAYAVVGSTDDQGNVTFGNLMLLRQGVSTYESPVSGRNRWGDYSATVLDPSDPTKFWTFQQFVSANNQWSVNITEIQIIPEPTSIPFVALLVAGLLARHRRRKW